MDLTGNPLHDFLLRFNVLNGIKFQNTELVAGTEDELTFLFNTIESSGVVSSVRCKSDSVGGLIEYSERGLFICKMKFPKKREVKSKHDLQISLDSGTSYFTFPQSVSVFEFPQSLTS